MHCPSFLQLCIALPSFSFAQGSRMAAFPSLHLQLRQTMSYCSSTASLNVMMFTLSPHHMWSSGGYAAHADKVARYRPVSWQEFRLKRIAGEHGRQGACLYVRGNVQSLLAPHMGMHIYMHSGVW